jgi:hypothetical protein
LNDTQCADFDNDVDLDILVTGTFGGSIFASDIFKNSVKLFLTQDVNNKTLIMEMRDGKYDKFEEGWMEI